MLQKGSTLSDAPNRSLFSGRTFDFVTVITAIPDIHASEVKFTVVVAVTASTKWYFS